MKQSMNQSLTKHPNLLKIAVLVSIIGILAIFVVKSYSSDLDVPISEANSYLGRSIAVSGEIKKVFISPSNTGFIDLEDNTGTITIVVFSSSKLDIVYDLKEGNTISVVGKVQEYKDELEIIAKEITEI